MRKTISRRIFLAIATATLLPATLAVFLLFYLLNANDSLVLGYLKNIAKDKNEVLNSYRSLIINKKTSLTLKSSTLGTFINKNLPFNSEKYPEFFKNLSKKYPELYSFTIFYSSSDIKSENIDQLLEYQWFEKNIILFPYYTYINKEKTGDKLKYSVTYQQFDNKIIRLTLALTPKFIDTYKKLAATYEDNTQMLNIYKNIRRYYWYFFFLFMIIIAFLTYISTGAILKGIAKRISILADTTKKLASTDEPDKLEVDVGNNYDEISMLALEFNKMIKELKTNRQKLIYHERMNVWQEVARKLAHEIKNPLTPIQLAIQQIQNKVPNDNEKFKYLVDQSAKMIIEEIDGLKRLVEAFGTLARLPDKKAKIMEVNSFITELKELVKLTYKQDLLKIENLPSEKIKIKADRLLLKRAFLNLIENAVQSSTQDDNIQVILRIEIDFNNIYFKVIDFGSGIQESNKIFDPYFTTKETGTGLGLPLAKKIILDHKGNLILSETSSSGSIFTIQLPLLK